MFDETRLRLGSVCKRGHRWEDQEYSLRYRSGGQCVVCVAERTKAFYSSPEGRESSKKTHAKYRQSEHGKTTEAKYFGSKHWRELSNAANQRYKQTEHGQEKVKINRANYHKSGKHAEACKRYNQTEQGRVYARIRTHRRRLRKLSCREPYTAEQVLEVMSLFDNSCAYCGSKDRLTIDHFVPLIQGGADAIWNIVPACLSCNSSKQTSHAETWYQSKSFYSEQRWQLIMERMINNG